MERTNVKLSTQAILIVAVVVVTGVALLGRAMFGWSEVHDYARFASYLLVASFAARFRVSIPRITGSMAVNLPFIFVALIELSLPEALAIAAISTFVQSFWPESKKRNLVQVMFNVGTLVMASQATWLAMRMPLHNPALTIAAGGLAILLSNTSLVAGIIAATEKAGFFQTWSNILQLTFPYYGLAAGVAALVKLANHTVGWQIPLFILPAMYFVYRSYTMYFQHLGEGSGNQGAFAMAAGAGH